MPSVVIQFFCEDKGLGCRLKKSLILLDVTKYPSRNLQSFQKLPKKAKSWELTYL